jgi:hypothetical protein
MGGAFALSTASGVPMMLLTHPYCSYAPQRSDKRSVLNTMTSPSTDAQETSANRLAGECWQANLVALAKSQPRLAEALRGEQIHVSEWIFARDGALTAFTGPGRWWTGCSLPHRAASTMLRTLEVSGVVGCLLDPPHAAHVRVTLDKLRQNQAAVTICPDLAQLALLLHCDNFAADVAANRLWFAWGDAWETELAKVFEGSPGLPTPSTFVRLPTHDDAVIEQLVKKAQDVFAAEGTRRAGAIRAIRSRERSLVSSNAPLAIIAPTLFRLWDDASGRLAALLPPDAKRIDTDDPAAASPLGLASTVEGCGALVAADFARADAPQLLPDDLPWITWVTSSRIPPFVPAATRDALLLADPACREKAAAQGWPKDRLAIATWPTRERCAPLPAKPVAALIADTKPLTPPQRLDDYSSHRLLWEQIAAELTADPSAALEDPEGYLTARRRRAGIDEAPFDQRLFLVDLIAPAIAQGICKILLNANVSLRLHGKGWAEIEDFARVASGAVTSRQELLAAVDAATLLIDPRPLPGAHPMHAMGRTVVRPQPKMARQFVDRVRQALAAPPAPSTSSAPLTFEQIRRFF